jgi:tRNA U34 5-methylaminomethyl-2-thiouridine-forming methyltransferase MnmC
VRGGAGEGLLCGVCAEWARSPCEAHEDGEETMPRWPKNLDQARGAVSLLDATLADFSLALLITRCLTRCTSKMHTTHERPRCDYRGAGARQNNRAGGRRKEEHRQSRELGVKGERVKRKTPRRWGLGVVVW